jgi:hypothetical protein
MYIEFSLPSGHAIIARQLIKAEVSTWAERFDIKFKTKTVKYTYRIILNSAEEYTLFGTSFEPRTEWKPTWRFVEPMSVDKDR